MLEFFNKICVNSISFSSFIGYIRQRNTKESFRAYLTPLLTLCHERHGGEIKEYKTNVFSVAPLIWQHSAHVFERTGGSFHPDINELIVSARNFCDKLMEITALLNVPETKFLVDVPVGVTLGFLELADDFYTKYKDWEAPDLQSMVGRLKRLIFSLHDTSFECEDDGTLEVIRTTTHNLCRKLLEYTNMGVMNSLNDELVQRIKAGIIKLSESLDESDVERSARMIARMRQRLIVTHNLSALAEVDELLTARNA